MAIEAGHWTWTASLRYLLLLPLLGVVLAATGELRSAIAAVVVNPVLWIIWGTVGFTFFYAPLAMAASLAPAWVVAATWPITILAGSALAPLIYSDSRRHVPRHAVLTNVAILIGIAGIQAEQATAVTAREVAASVVLISIAALCYPLGNRKVMLELEKQGLQLSALSRLAAMTVGSIPMWLAIAALGYRIAGPPPLTQVVGAAVVALSSGLIATRTFFRATEIVRQSASGLAAVEATQAVELPFVLALEVLFLRTKYPGILGALGIAVVIVGMAVHSYLAEKIHPPSPPIAESSASHTRDCETSPTGRTLQTV